MSSRPKYKVLVAEDDPFQRLSIIDILKISNYDVTTVENGVQALDKLMDPDNHFDLILLDLLMPEKSGKDVLEAIMQDERLGKLPVIVMSAKNDKSIISECLKTGAKTFIVKPLRVQECRSFENFIGTTGETEAEQNLSKYTVIKALGSGAAGSVDLVRHKETEKLFALKTIPLSHLNEKERLSAEGEVHFLRVLVGPTLIKSYQSYIEKDKIYIIMEYAEGGNLSEKIQYAKFKKQPFDTDIILNWVSQIILGVMLMHSKNILHRDLKGQNLFLTKEGILKIGDFGISKELETMSKLAETNVGTPYFMAPEVCRGELYGEKADVWAIGCILYELAMLRKPFDADSIQGVFEKIIHKPLDLMSENIDTDIRMLIIAMLDKDPSRRPSIWELSNIPCINDRISAFVKENKGEDSVNCVFERRANQDESKEQDGDQMYSVFDADKLDVLAHLIRADIRIEEVSIGWFHKAVKGTSGYEISKWIREHVEKDDKKSEDIGQKMLDQEIIFRVDGNTVFQGNHATLYRFYEDRGDIASNLLRPWKGDVGNSLDVSSDLVRLIEEIYQEAFFEGDEYPEIHAEEALKSPKYDSFVTNIAQLELVDLNFKTYNEGLGFFLNVYQCMYIHSFLKNINSFRDTNSSGGIISSILSYFWSENDSFFYNIGGYNFTLEELKHGLLRGNKKKPGSFFRVLSKNDERTMLLDNLSDPKILFLCLDMPEIPEHIECFDDPDTLDEKIDYFLTEYFNVKVEIDTMNEEITLPKVIEKYRYDLGGSEEQILKFIWEWYQSKEFELDYIIKLVNRKNMMIRYDE